MTPLEIPALAGQIAPAILPYLPYLLKGVEKAGDLATAAGRKLGEVDWDTVFTIWEKLKPQVEKQPEVKERLTEAAEKPDDPRATTLVEWELEKVLAALPPSEVQEIRNLIQSTKTTNQTVIASGERAVSVGGDVSDSPITTGNQSGPPEEKKPKKKR